MVHTFKCGVDSQGNKASCGGRTGTLACSRCSRFDKKLGSKYQHLVSSRRKTTPCWKKWENPICAGDLSTTIYRKTRKSHPLSSNLATQFSSCCCFHGFLLLGRIPYIERDQCPCLASFFFFFSLVGMPLSCFFFFFFVWFECPRLAEEKTIGKKKGVK